MVFQNYALYPHMIARYEFRGRGTLPLGVRAFASQYSVDTAKVLAFTSLSMIPALVFFSLFERRIVGGLTGAVKG